eukprot:scaffold177_cov334-Pavlova_lutheri.AAC.77
MSPPPSFTTPSTSLLSLRVMLSFLLLLSYCPSYSRSPTVFLTAPTTFLLLSFSLPFPYCLSYYSYYLSPTVLPTPVLRLSFLLLLLPFSYCLSHYRSLTVFPTTPTTFPLLSFLLPFSYFLSYYSYYLSPTVLPTTFLLLSFLLLLLPFPYCLSSDSPITVSSLLLSLTLFVPHETPHPNLPVSKMGRGRSRALSLSNNHSKGKAIGFEPDAFRVRTGMRTRTRDPNHPFRADGGWNGRRRDEAKHIRLDPRRTGEVRER